MKNSALDTAGQFCRFCVTNHYIYCFIVKYHKPYDIKHQ